jgi:hypothetical protein
LSGGELYWNFLPRLSVFLASTTIDWLRGRHDSWQNDTRHNDIQSA